MIEKETRIEEEVRVGKHGEERTETVRDTVRETHIDIERLRGEIPTEYGYAEYEPEYREHYETAYGEAGGEFPEYEHAYRFGHTLGASEEYRDRDYDKLEPNIRRSFEDRYGRGTYDQYSDAMRQGFETARRRWRS